MSMYCLQYSDILSCVQNSKWQKIEMKNKMVISHRSSNILKLKWGTLMLSAYFLLLVVVDHYYVFFDDHCYYYGFLSFYLLV